MSTNPYATEVDEHEILETELEKPIGKRLTNVRCVTCGVFLSESLLWDIRQAVAPVRHYDCKSIKIYHVAGDDVRNDHPDDKLFEATRECNIGKIILRTGYIAWFNGKSLLIRPVGHAPQCDEETNDVAAVELALRRGWLKPYIRPEDKPINKAISWLKGLGSKAKNEKAAKQQEVSKPISETGN